MMAKEKDPNWDKEVTWIGHRNGVPIKYELNEGEKDDGKVEVLFAKIDITGRNLDW